MDVKTFTPLSQFIMVNLVVSNPVATSTYTVKPLFERHLYLKHINYIILLLYMSIHQSLGFRMSHCLTWRDRHWLVFIGFPQSSTAEMFNGIGSQIVTSQFSFSVLCALTAYFIAYRLYLSTMIMTLVAGKGRKTPENQ